MAKSRYFLYINHYSEKRKKVKRRPRYFRALLRRGDGKIGGNRRKRTSEALRLRKIVIIRRVKRDKRTGARRVETFVNRGAVFSKRSVFKVVERTRDGVFFLRKG